MKTEYEANFLDVDVEDVRDKLRQVGTKVYQSVTIRNSNTTRKLAELCR